MKLGEYVFYKAKYTDNGRLAIVAMQDDEPYANITVNIDDGRNIDNDMAYLDINNGSSDLLELIEPYIEQLWLFPSGFVTYPMVKFDNEFIDSLDELT